MGIVFAPGVFRLFLACLVLLSHISSLDVGETAVMIFFILSGYWVPKMYQEKYMLANSGTIKFYFSRVFRIWPLYIIVTLAAAIFFNLVGEDVWLNFFDYIIFGLATVDSNISGVAWSLDIELQFYIFLPVLVLFLIRFGILSFLVLVSVLFLLSLLLLFVFDIKLFAVYLPVFVLGYAVYFLGIKSSSKLAIFSLICFFGIGLLVFSFEYTRPLLLKNESEPFNLYFFTIPWMLTLIPFIAYSVRFKWLDIDRDFGNLSYTLYLVHWPVIFVFSRYDFVDSKLVWVFVSLLISVIVYFFIEKPVESFRVKVIDGLF